MIEGKQTHRITALINGPIPRRLVLNEGHDRGLRSKVVRLNRALTQAEKQASTGDPKHITKVIQLRTYQQGFEVQCIDGLILHRRSYPESREESSLWQCIIENSDRLRRLKQALTISQQPNVNRLLFTRTQKTGI